MPVYLRDRSAQTSIRVAKLRQEQQNKFSISTSHSILTPGRPVRALTLSRQAHDRVATGVPIYKSLVRLDRTKHPRCKWELNPDPPLLEVDAFTTRPAGRCTMLVSEFNAQPSEPLGPPGTITIPTTWYLPNLVCSQYSEVKDCLCSWHKKNITRCVNYSCIHLLRVLSCQPLTCVHVIFTSEKKAFAKTFETQIHNVHTL